MGLTVPSVMAAAAGVNLPRWRPSQVFPYHPEQP